MILLNIFFPKKKILAFRRGHDIGSVIAFLNLDNETIHFNYSVGNQAGNYKNIFDSDVQKIEHILEIHLSPGDYLVLEKID